MGVRSLLFTVASDKDSRVGKIDIERKMILKPREATWRRRTLKIITGYWPTVRHMSACWRPSVTRVIHGPTRVKSSSFLAGTYTVGKSSFDPRGEPLVPLKGSAILALKIDLAFLVFYLVFQY